MDGEGVVRGRTEGLVEPNFSWGLPLPAYEPQPLDDRARIMGRVVWWAHTDRG